jgi:tRNA pseudouridine38/39 synthase
LRFLHKESVLTMASNEPPCHPVLQELKLTAKNLDNTVSPLEILNQLLRTNVLTPKSVKMAHESVLQSKQPKEESKQSTKVLKTPRTRHIALRFYYNGANYSGLAQNLGQENDNSVERALFQVLSKVKLVECRETCGYSRCGRTDRGVSAAGQVVALKLKSAIPQEVWYDEQGQSLISEDDLPKNETDTLKAWVLPKKKNKIKGEINDSESPPPRQEEELTEYAYAKILNNLLPDDIRILGWAPVSQEFSARFSATTRTYRYFFVQRQMSLDRIRQALALLVGKHDFRNFCKMNVEKVYNFVRVIHAARVVDLSDGVCYVQIVGQAFLWHQIRCFVEILFMVGRGLEEPSVISELLDVDKYPGKPSYHLAAEQPLVLHDCGYPNLSVGYSAQNVWTATCQLEQQWEELTLAAARLRNCIESLKGISVLKDDVERFAEFKLKERTKKQHNLAGNGGMSVEAGSIPEDSDSTTLTWEKAVSWLQGLCLVPDSNGLGTAYHAPLMQRSKGTTYEQKVDALKKNDKRRMKYDDNVIKKRQTKEEDAAFYQHMIKQGGTGK